jgi:hypothetical protein
MIERLVKQLFSWPTGERNEEIERCNYLKWLKIQSAYKTPLMSDCRNGINFKEQNAISTVKVARRSRNFLRYMKFIVHYFLHSVLSSLMSHKYLPPPYNHYCLHSVLSSLMSHNYLPPPNKISRPQFVQLCFKDYWYGVLMCYEVQPSIILHCVHCVYLCCVQPMCCVINKDCVPVRCKHKP